MPYFHPEKNIFCTVSWFWREFSGKLDKLANISETKTFAILRIG